MEFGTTTDHNPAAEDVAAGPASPSGAALGPKRLHPAWILLSLVGLLRGFAIPLIIVLLGGGRQGEVWFLAIGGTVALIGLGVQTAIWLKFRYEVTGGELRVRSGLISRNERTVPLERIQAVDTSENLLQRLFGVLQVKVETAAGGAGKSDVVLEALSHREAAVLQERLAARLPRPAPAIERVGSSSATGASANDATFAPASSELLYRVTLGDLVVAGLTSGRVGPALAILVAGWQLLDDVAGEDVYERLAMEAPSPTVQIFLVIALGIAIVAWLLAIAGTILTFGNFELRRSGDRLLISHGLLDRRRTTIPLRRIQAVTITEGLLRLPFGLAAVRVESAGFAGDASETGYLSPIIRRSRLPELLAAACPELSVDLAALEGRSLNRLPGRALRRYITSEAWQALILAIGAWVLAIVLPWTPWWWGGLVLALVPLAALYGLVVYRDTRWALDSEGRLILRTRDWVRRTAIVPRRRVQLRTVRQTIFQRRVALANLEVAVASGGAGGRFGVRHLDLEDAYGIVERLGPGDAPMLHGVRPGVANVAG